MTDNDQLPLIVVQDENVPATSSSWTAGAVARAFDPARLTQARQLAGKTKWLGREVRRGSGVGVGSGQGSSPVRWMVQAVSRASWGLPELNPVSSAESSYRSLAAE